MMRLESLSKCKKDLACHTPGLIINEPLRVPRSSAPLSSSQGEPAEACPEPVEGGG